ncbi:hypothetical protein CWE13_10365 [Aliidiomarina shirensis]|uniref:Uncharacterized protein n=1 Tax=Aliidiomarina shirensis TaxID=1048642 RepID=A0A432WQ78_9GAMM|nr:hypothetical protein [Aliidiomarina shirensis]RUO35944.1 hypothetical protein CWE13_10365 [Aliidiomarina shirensis]
MNSPEDTEYRLFTEAVKAWWTTFGGVSAIDLAEKAQIPHGDAMRFVESWVEAGRGTMNANVELNLVSVPSPRSSEKFSFTSINTHIFFPSREELTEHFYSSGNARTEPPEFKKRLMCGEHQLALSFFSEEVLARYFSHLDWYEVDDSSAGGHIRTTAESPSDRFIDVRFGKGRALDGKTFVTAIYKDLYCFSDSEQRHWHAYEIARPNLDPNDENLRLFAARTYDGAWVEFPKPLKAVQDSLVKLNSKFSPHPLFGRLENEHLRMPVENTNKALADSCSELYKIVGSDSLKPKPLKALLQYKFEKTEDDFIHSSGRPLSALQLVELVERELELVNGLSDAIKNIAKYRVEADHKVLSTSSDKQSYGEEFELLCKQFVSAANLFADALEAKNVT